MNDIIATLATRYPGKSRRDYRDAKAVLLACENAVKAIQLNDGDPKLITAIESASMTTLRRILG